MATDVSRSSPTTAEPLLPNHRWNAWAFIVDWSTFQVGENLVNATTVLPALVAALSNSDVLVGLSSGLISGGWLLPQLIIAGAVSKMRRRKPIIVRTAWLCRPIMLLLALSIWLLGDSRPNATLATVMIGVFIFWVSDAIVSVPWLDLMGKTITTSRRGRVLGTLQVIGGVGGIGAGVIVHRVLGEGSRWSFPANYALLFALAALTFFVSATALSMIREPEEDDGEQKETPSTREVISMMPRILTQDKPFVRLVIVRVLAGFATMANAFYVLHATRNLGLGIRATGLFVSAQVVGSLASGFLMGAVQDRWGPLVHMRLTIAFLVLPPVVALATTPFVGALGQNVVYPYLLVYFFLGVGVSAIGWPYVNWILEYAEEQWRPLYFGMLNTLSAIVMLAPALGGWIATGSSYPVVFVLGLVFAVIALASSFTLPSTRKAAQSA